MVDLDELIRLHKVATEGQWHHVRHGWYDVIISVDEDIGRAEEAPNAAFIAAIKNACDDGLLERLRTAERELALLSDPEAVRVNIMRGTIAKPDDLVSLHDTNGPVAALKAENERLREACRYIVDAGDSGDEMTAIEKARTALDTTNG